MRPQDIVVILKILYLNDWTQTYLARSLHLSQSEISESIARSTYSKLIYDNGRMINRMAFSDFIFYGLPYAFPQQPGIIQRGVPTAHSAEPLVNEIQSNELYVWPYYKGEARGQSILPLYPKVVMAVQEDENLYRNLALIDAIRVGKVRERKRAMEILEAWLR